MTKVLDGDTFLTATRKSPLRLANVDAPERGSPGAAAATEQLRRLVVGKEVRIETVARDSHGRSVADDDVGNKSVNKQMRQRLK